MSTEAATAEQAQYAAFRLRFRALCVDLGICLGVFVIGGLITGIVFENSAAGRIAGFIVIVAVILGYEPFMIARYGGTIGHRKSNIKIICARSDERLPLWRAVVRSVVKQAFGLISFVFMFVTSRAQGLHDLLGGSRVIIRDPRIAVETDFFEPAPRSTESPVSRTRRVLVILLCNVLLLVLYSVISALFVSLVCLEGDVCSDSEGSALSILGGVWFILAGFSTILGWQGRLPGCRRQASR